MTAKSPRRLATAAEDSPAQARAQADAYDSLFASMPLELDNDDTMLIPPHPDYGLLDDDRMQAYDELLFEADTLYEREPDVLIPEQHLKDVNGVPNGAVMPAETIRGALRRPFRILAADGTSELVRPPHTVRVVIAALGETEYKRLREGGRNASDVWKIWSEQSIKIRERQQSDSKSAGGTVDLAAVPASDRQ